MPSRLVLLFAALAVVLAACGDPDDTVPQEAEPPPPDQEVEGPPAPDEDPLAGIERTRIHYTVTTEGVGDEGVTVEEDVTVSWDPPRLAVIMDTGRVIQTAEEAVLCFDEGDGPECQRLPGDTPTDALVNTFVPFFTTAQTVSEQGELVGAQATEDREVAGVQATCVLVTPPAEPGAEGAGQPAELCADPDTGATLYYEAVAPDGSTQTLQAVEIGEPRDDDFEPIAPVTDAPEPDESF